MFFYIEKDNEINDLRNTLELFTKEGEIKDQDNETIDQLLDFIKFI